MGDASQLKPMSTGNIREKYDIGQDLCSGSFAKVVHATSKATGESVAIKVTQLAGVNTDKKKAWMAAEIEITRRVDHPGIVKLIEIVRGTEHLYMVFERMDQDLFEWMRQLRKQGMWMTEKHIALMMYTLMSALKYLHAHDIVHRDIKPENLLINSKHQVKLTDFGIAKIVANEVTPFGSRSYMAPEIISGVMQGVDPGQTPRLVMTKQEVKDLDVWSCGTVLYFMLSGTLPPIKGRSKEQLQQLAKKPEEWDRVLFPEDRWKRVSAGAKDVVKGMLAFDPKSRMSADASLKMPFLQQAEAAAAKQGMTEEACEKRDDAPEMDADALQKEIEERADELRTLIGDNH